MQEGHDRLSWKSGLLYRLPQENSYTAYHETETRFSRWYKITGGLTSLHIRHSLAYIAKND